MTDQEKIEMLREALKKTYAICSGVNLTKAELVEALRSAKSALSIVAAPTQPEPETDARGILSWTEMLSEADKIVKSKFVYKRFIDGTPLANDVPIWMAQFALEQARATVERK